jgi:CDGSH-type Zn-finger protein
MNTITVTKDGPLEARGDVDVVRAGGAPIARGAAFSLCRCGESATKPFCDGSHARVGFKDPGEVRERNPTAPLAEGKLTIEVSKDGPLLARGPFELRDSQGRARQHISGGHLCRCGASNSKPICDGRHLPLGFQG